MCKFIRFKLCGLLVSFIFWVSPVIADDDLYLQELEAEVQSSSLVQKDKQRSAISPKQQEEISIQKKHQKEFKQVLKSELPATFRAYLKLNEDDKEKVVDTYYNNGKNISTATRQLFNLYFKSKREGSR